jgi:endonuclease/exonuclease/phosphatase family metal-dependent hydrolase
MRLRVATFNLGNLYSRYDFGAAAGLPSAPGAVKVVSELFPAMPERGRVRSYRGPSVRSKSARERARLASRIHDLDADLIAVQEVEDIDALNRFATDDLDGAGYLYRVLLEGNDPRLNDVGLLSRCPFGAVTSWRNAVAGRGETKPVFSRDLLQVEVLNPNRSRKLFTIFNTHFSADPDDAEADATRLREATAAARIITEQTRPHQRFLVCGAFHDVPDSPFLAPLVTSQLQLIDALDGRSTSADLTDQIWLSPALALHRSNAGVSRDYGLGAVPHDPTWVDLQFSSGGRGRWRDSKNA